MTNSARPDGPAADPERFGAEFSGSERTVAEYLLAQVQERQGEQVRRLLLRTCLVERISGGLADALTGGSGGERILQDLEAANAFVVALDAARSWFRYHRLFGGLLQLERRRIAPGEVTGLPARFGRLEAAVDLADDEQAQVGLAAGRHVCLNRAASAVPRSRESPGSGDNFSPVWRQVWDRTGSAKRRSRRLRL